MLSRATERASPSSARTLVSVCLVFVFLCFCVFCVYCWCCCWWWYIPQANPPHNLTCPPSYIFDWTICVGPDSVPSFIACAVHDCARQGFHVMDGAKVCLLSSFLFLVLVSLCCLFQSLSSPNPQALLLLFCVSPHLTPTLSRSRVSPPKLCVQCLDVVYVFI